MDAKKAIETETPVTLYYSYDKREISIEDGSVITVDEAQKLFAEGLVYDCNCAMSRLCNCDFDMEKVEQEYREMDE